MILSTQRILTLKLLFLVFAVSVVHAQKPPYDVFPKAEAPYFRVRYEASKEPGQLIFPVSYTIWIPPNVKQLRGIVVHQHGCGEGSCRSGLTGAYDLHWQALAKKHDCALLAASYEQPQQADCQMWCDPRNGSAKVFDRSLVDLGELSGHPELASVPLALWGHSGGGHWCGGMLMIQPERIAAAWLRSGVPLFEANPDRPKIRIHSLPEAALKVPVMCNLGTKEGVTVTDGRFAGVWPANQKFFDHVRGKGGLVGIAIDPLTSHECGNSRYLAIPWIDLCLEMRLPATSGGPLREIPMDGAWLAQPTGTTAVAANEFQGDPNAAAWLPNERFARAWMQFRIDTKVEDSTPPPAPSRVTLQGNRLTWQADADIESGIEKFLVLRNGNVLAEVTGDGKNRFGRLLFQNLQYSDTPTQPLSKMEFVDKSAQRGVDHGYSVITVNTAGLKSEPTWAGPADAED